MLVNISGMARAVATVKLYLRGEVLLIARQLSGRLPNPSFYLCLSPNLP